MSDTKEKPRFDRATAEFVAKELLSHLAPHCDQIEVAGSYRRGKKTVGDIEIVFVPKYHHGWRADFLLHTPEIADTDVIIDGMLANYILAKRALETKAGTAWGKKNKLAIHRATGLPVDLFTATRENFANYLVCRTGGAKSNVAICNAAIAKGWKWNPYGEGFSRPATQPEKREIHTCATEREVFEFVGLPYLEPHERP